jgi:RES domain-containing protein
MDYPVTTLAEPRTVRLVASARLRDPVLLALVAPALLDDLAEIEGATSARLRAEGAGAFAPGGRPHANFVNAAFAYFRPRELNRFNGPGRGAWYAALAVATALAEVTYHLGRELARAGSWHATVEYAEMWASFAGAFVDLRGLAPPPPCLDADERVGYPAGNALAERARAEGLNGVVYPSVRHAGGICLVALWPHAVQSVAQGTVWRVRWAGRPEPDVTQAAASADGPAPGSRPAP